MNKRRRNIDIGDVRERARGQWDAILLALCPDLGPALEKPGMHVDCIFHDGKNDFRVFRDVAETGGAICSCGQWGDGFNLIRHYHGVDLPEAIAMVSAQLGEPMVRASVSTARRRSNVRQIDDARKRQEARNQIEKVRKTWASSLPANHPDAAPLRKYLVRRGINLQEIPSMLRLHPALPYFERDEETGRMVRLGTTPAMIALVLDARGLPIALHRTYLDFEGNKAPVADPKKMTMIPEGRHVTGGAIRLVEPGPILNIAEGIETALAVMEATGIPTWPSISASLMKSVVVPDHVEAVCFWADKDRKKPDGTEGAGQKAAYEAAERLRAMGIRAGVMVPPLDIPENGKGVDWLDVKNRLGIEAFEPIRSQLRAAVLRRQGVLLDEFVNARVA